MRSNAVVIGGILLQNPTQMFLAQNNNVVHALPPDRSEQPFGKAILPRRSWCARLVPDPHGAQSACDDCTVDPIAIPDHVTRSSIPRKRLGYLTCNPLRCRCDSSCTTAACDGGGARRTQQRGQSTPVGSSRSAVRHIRFAMGSAAMSAGHECPLIEVFG